MTVSFVVLLFDQVQRHVGAMSRIDDSTNLTGKILIALPGMDDPRFEKSVVYLCSHSSDETMGLIVNKPAPGVDLGHLLKTLKIEGDQASSDIRVQFGGPVEQARGFVLHSNDFTTQDGTLTVDAEFSMTANTEVLQAIAQGSGPKDAILMLGYSGWGPGQLENEIAMNGWLVADASPDIVFRPENTTKWTSALKTLGVDPLVLSATGGRA